MSELKLEVGKSYRNRKGKVVEIISHYKHAYEGAYPFTGDNGAYYTPSGGFAVLWKTKEDLIEEVRPKRRKVKWPIRGRVKRKDTSEAIYYTPDEVEMIIDNPTYAYPEAEESFGPESEAPELTFSQAEYAAALRLAGIDTNRPELFYRIATLMQETEGDPGMKEVMEVW